MKFRALDESEKLAITRLYQKGKLTGFGRGNMEDSELHFELNHFCAVLHIAQSTENSPYAC